MIAAPKILDLRGHDISPRGLHWDIGRSAGKWSLELAFDDSKLATPYVIDPASYNVGAGTTGPTAAAASIALAVPASVKLGDLLIAHVTWKGGTNITAAQPGGWTQLDSTRNDGTNIGAQVWYKNASVADTAGGTYTWTFTPNAIGTGGIAAYTGIDKSVAPQVVPARHRRRPTIRSSTTRRSPRRPTAPRSSPCVGCNKVSTADHPDAARLGQRRRRRRRCQHRPVGDRQQRIRSPPSSPTSRRTSRLLSTRNGSNNLSPATGKNISHVAFRIALKADVTASDEQPSL